MARIIPVTDLSLPQLDPYARLTGNQLKSRRDPDSALLIAEGAKVVGHALDAGYAPVSLLLEEKQLAPSRELLDRCGSAPAYVAPDGALEQLTGFRSNRTSGILCAFRRPVLPDVEDVCANARRIAVLEGIVDPSNVGAIFRSAAALGMDAVLVTPSCCDPLHRRSVRVSMGTVFQVPWTVIGSTSAEWPSPGLERLSALGFRTAALALTDRSLSLDDPAPAGADKLAVVLGTEGDGLAAETVARCDWTLRIPMKHGVDSLNVNAAAAVAFWQLRAR